ncbi:MAG: cobalamin-dependent protein [Desulfuromonadales bacterium]
MQDCHDITCQLPETARAYLEALLTADRAGAHRIVTEALDNGLSIRELYISVFQPAQYEVGRLWLLNKVSIAEEHFCTAATQAIMAELYPQIISSRRIGKTLVAACIGSELHEIGVRMVADFFEMDGWDTYYLGSGVSRKQMVSAIQTHKPHLLALSATITYHVPIVSEMIAAIKAEFSDATPPIMVGGLPFNSNTNLWRDVGADLWARGAADAVTVAQHLITK